MLSIDIITLRERTDPFKSFGLSFSLFQFASSFLCIIHLS